jgi:archaellum component FlaG (FlaF/FlaG flagellin family)
MFGEGQCWYDDVEIEADVEVPDAPDAVVTPLDDGETGAVVEVDGTTHVMLTAQEAPVTVEVAGRSITTDAEIAVVSFEADAPRAFMLRGTTLTVDGEAVEPATGQWRSGPMR